MSETTIERYSITKSTIGKRNLEVWLRTIFVPLLFVTFAFILWIVSLPKIDPSKMSDIGLVSVLPITYYAALGLLTISYMVNIHRKDANTILLSLHILLLIFIIHGTPQIVYGTVRYAWAWKHIGIVDYIQRNGSVDPTISNLNAYHNWPGFFALAAMYNTVAGLASSLSYAGWGPVFFNLIDFGAILVLFKTLTNDRRLVWLSVWIFYLFSWIGQDYFSPQAFAYFLYLVTIIIVLKWFRRRSVISQTEIIAGKPTGRLHRLYSSIVRQPIPDEPAAIQTSARHRLFFILIMIMIFSVIASSHQLTPLMLVSALALLVIFQITSQRFLPILMAAITAAWVFFMAVGFLNGNLYWIIKSIGSLLDNVNGNFINLAIASPGQQFVAEIDRFLSAAIWVLGFVGVYRRYRSGKWDYTAILLAIAPMPMVMLNSYGGEMIFRVYMFSLPFVAYLASSIIFPRLNSGISLATPVLSSILSLIILPGFLISYYGKERMNYFSPDEVAAADVVFTTAPKGSLIMDGVYGWPRQYINYEDYNYQYISLLPTAQIDKIMQNPARQLPYYMEIAAPGSVFVPPAPAQPETEPNLPGVQGKPDYPAAFLVITRSQIAQAEMTGSLPANWATVIENSLAQSPNFRVVYSNKDAVIYQYVDLGEP